MKILQLLNMTILAMVQKIKTLRGAATMIAIGVALLAGCAASGSGPVTGDPDIIAGCDVVETGAGDCDSDGVDNAADEFDNDRSRSCTVMVDNAGSATADCDNDGSVNNVDVDDDNDGLIEINFLEDLDAIRNDLNGDGAAGPGATTGHIGNTGAPTGGLRGYELARSLDFSDEAITLDTSYRDAATNNPVWFPTTSCGTTNAGWTPIGGQFTTMFDGNDNTITNLRICRNDVRSVGLFGQIGAGGMVRDLMLVDATVAYTGASDNINSANTGLLAGQSNGTIVAVGVSGSASSVTGGSGLGNRVGGLVGQNQGTITASYATIATVSSGTGDASLIGGLVGANRTGSMITASYASGTVDGGTSTAGFSNVGGLVGNNTGTITASYATATANGASGEVDTVGGLVGQNQGTITASYATGTANGNGTSSRADSVGGLAGQNVTSVSVIVASYASGNANATNASGSDSDVGDVGILTGATSSADTITASYGFGMATGDTKNTTDGTPPMIGDPPMSVTLDTLTAANSSATVSERWSDSVWDFGTTMQRPVLKWVTKSDFTCDVTLLPTGQTCGGIIPGQETR